MRFGKRIGAVCAAVSVGVGLAVLAPQAALASVGDCDTSYSFCWWNSGSYSGIPTGVVAGTPSQYTDVNIPDNIMSAGLSYQSTPNKPALHWCATNVTTFATSETLYAFKKGVAHSFSGTSADNKADDLYYSNCAP